MAFKFILSHHVRRILNDVEEKQKKDIKDFAGGHLNESVLLKAPLVLNRKPWPSAHAEDLKLTKASKPQHKPRKVKESGTPQETLYDFSLGTSGVIPPVRRKGPKTPDVKYRLATEAELEEERRMGLDTITPKSLYTELEDGVLIEEMPQQELMMPVQEKKQVTFSQDRAPAFQGDSMFTSQTSFMSKRSDMSPIPNVYSVVSMHSKGVTKKDQYRRMKAFDTNVLHKKEMAEKNILSGEKAARHHEFKLQQDLEDLNLNGIGPNFHRLQVFSNVLEDVIEESPTFNYILRCIKTEYDNYIASLLDSQSSQQHLLREQVDQMASRGTSRPDDMAAASDKLMYLEQEARQLLNMNQKLREDVKTEQENLNKTPEAKRNTPVAGYSRKEQPVELSLELENMKALILEKLDELGSLRVKLREEFVPMTVCTHLEQCIKETEVEVQKLLKQNEYFERSIAEMESDLKEAIVEADTSEKDARRIWHKVNSTKGMPGMRPGSGEESDEDDDDESKWNWYIS